MSVMKNRNRNIKSINDWTGTLSDLGPQVGVQQDVTVGVDGVGVAVCSELQEKNKTNGR